MKQVFEYPETVEQLEAMAKAGILEVHHTALKRGYVSRKIPGIINDYNGRFGKGYTLDTPNWKSTYYHYRTYYTFVS